MHPTTTMLMQRDWVILSEEHHQPIARNVTQMLREAGRNVRCVRFGGGESGGESGGGSAGESAGESAGAQLDEPSACASSLASAQAAGPVSVVGAIVDPEHGLEIVEQEKKKGLSRTPFFFSSSYGLEIIEQASRAHPILPPYVTAPICALSIYQRHHFLIVSSAGDSASGISSSSGMARVAIGAVLSNGRSCSVSWSMRRH